jgi:hypothetical protein
MTFIAGFVTGCLAAVLTVVLFARAIDYYFGDDE